MTFDLKGSKKNRKVKFAQKWWLQNFHSKPKGHKMCLKDLNFIEINRDLNQTLVNFPSDRINQYSRVLSEDTKFLKKHNIIDYSMLLVIEFIDEKNLKKESINLNPSLHASIFDPDDLLKDFAPLPAFSKSRRGTINTKTQID